MKTGWDMNVSREVFEKPITEVKQMSEAKEILRALLKSPIFFGAVVAFVNVLVAWLAPGVPKEVVGAGNAVVAALGAVIAAYYAGLKTPETLRALIAERGRDA